MYISKYFSLQELLPDELYHSLPDNIGWILFDDRILKLADDIREIYGKCTINGNGLENCGFRISPIFAKFSQHLYGRALDIHILEIENKNLEHDLKIEEYNKVRKYLMKLDEFKDARFENNISWLHIDVGNSDIKLFEVNK